MSYFLATNNTTQAITVAANYQDVSFQTAVLDPDSGVASNRFTVPASWNGKYGEIFGSVVTVGVARFELRMQVSTDSGSTWADVGWFGSTAIGQGGAATTGARLMNTGDIYRLLVRCYNFDETLQNSPEVFLSGHIIDAGRSSVERFKATNNATQAVAGSTVAQVNFQTELLDTAGGYNPATGEFTVPASLNGGIGIFYASCEINSTEDDTQLLIQKDDGITPAYYARHYTDGTGGVTFMNAKSGIVQLATGDIWTVDYRCAVSATTIKNVDWTYFSGEFWVP